MALVFQYGSNLSEENLNSKERLNGAAIKRGIVFTVSNYELDFNIWSKTNNCAVANLTPNKGREIWGVLYSISDDRIFRSLCETGKTCLDKIEGEGFTYRREFIQVAYPNGNCIKENVITYFGINGKTGLRTSKEYVSHIISGLKSNDIPQDYVNYVIEKITQNNFEITLDNLLTKKGFK